MMTYRLLSRQIVMTYRLLSRQILMTVTDRMTRQIKPDDNVLHKSVFGVCDNVGAEPRASVFVQKKVVQVYVMSNILFTVFPISKIIQ